MAPRIDSSSTLASTVTEASATIEQMTVSIDQMARNLESLAGTVTETSATVEEMTTSIEGVARNAETLSGAAQRTSSTVTEMAGAVNDVAKITTTQPRDWTPTGEQITQAGCNEPYPDTGRLTVFVYDGHPGGAGFAERGHAVAARWLRVTRDAITACE